MLDTPLDLKPGEGETISKYIDAFENGCAENSVNPVKVRLACLGNILFNHASIESQLLFKEELKKDKSAFSATKDTSWTALLAEQMFGYVFMAEKTNLGDRIRSLVYAIPQIIGLRESDIKSSRYLFITGDGENQLVPKGWNQFKLTPFVQLMGMEYARLNKSNAIQEYIARNFRVSGFGGKDVVKDPDADTKDVLLWTNKITGLLKDNGIEDQFSTMDSLSILYFCSTTEGWFDPANYSDFIKNLRNMYYNARFIQSVVDTLKLFYDTMMKDYYLVRYERKEVMKTVENVMNGLNKKNHPEVINQYTKERNTWTNIVDSTIALLEVAYYEDALDIKEAIKKLQAYKVSQYSVPSTLAYRHYQLYTRPYLEEVIQRYLEQFQKMYLMNPTTLELKYMFFVLFELVSIRNRQPAPRELLDTRISQLKDFLLKSKVNENDIMHGYFTWNEISGLDESKFALEFINMLRIITAKGKVTTIKDLRSWYNPMDLQTQATDDVFSQLLLQWNEVLMRQITVRYVKKTRERTDPNRVNNSGSMMLWMELFHQKFNEGVSDDTWKGIVNQMETDFIIEGQSTTWMMDFLLDINEDTFPFLRETWFNLTGKKHKIMPDEPELELQAKPFWFAYQYIIPIHQFLTTTPSSTFLDTLASHSKSGVKERNGIANAINKIRTMEDRIMDIYEKRLKAPLHDVICEDNQIIFHRLGGDLLQSDRPVQQEFEVMIPIPQNMDIVRADIWLTSSRQSSVVSTVTREIESMHYLRETIVIPKWESSTYQCGVSFFTTTGALLAVIYSRKIHVTIFHRCLRCGKDVPEAYSKRKREDDDKDVCRFQLDMSFFTHSMLNDQETCNGLDTIVRKTEPFGVTFSWTPSTPYLVKLGNVVTELTQWIRTKAVFRWEDYRLQQLALRLCKAAEHARFTVRVFLASVRNDLDIRVEDDTLTLTELHEFHRRWLDKDVPFPENRAFSSQAMELREVLFDAPQSSVGSRKYLPTELVRMPLGIQVRPFKENYTTLKGTHNATSSMIQLPAFQVDDGRTAELLEQIMVVKFDPTKHVTRWGKIVSDIRKIHNNRTEVTFIPGDLISEGDSYFHLNTKLGYLNETFNKETKRLQSLIREDLRPGAVDLEVLLLKLNNITMTMSNIVKDYIQHLGVYE